MCSSWSLPSTPTTTRRADQRIRLPILSHPHIACSLSVRSIAHLQGQGPYARQLKKIETEISDIQKRVNDKIGIKESDTGLAAPNLWDIHADKVSSHVRFRRERVKGAVGVGRALTRRSSPPSPCSSLHLHLAQTWLTSLCSTDKERNTLCRLLVAPRSLKPFVSPTQHR